MRLHSRAKGVRGRVGVWTRMLLDVHPGFMSELSGRAVEEERGERMAAFGQALRTAGDEYWREFAMWDAALPVPALED
jgi:hypothetical protein